VIETPINLINSLRIRLAPLVLLKVGIYVDRRELHRLSCKVLNLTYFCIFN